jgi:AcrR family transcriptional regulator
MPRNQPRENARKARSDLYRQLILDAAEGAFAQRGVEDTKMEEIAARSGLSLGTLYSVFAGKLELVRAVHETRLGEVLQRAADAGRGLDDPLAMLLAGVRSYVEFFVVHPDYLRMHLREGYAWGLLDSSLSTREQADAWREGVAMQAALFERGIGKACSTQATRG